MKETHEVCAYIWPVFPSSPYWGSQFPGLDRVTFHPSGVAEVREFSVVLRPGVRCHVGSDSKTTKLLYSKPSCFKKKIEIITKEKLPSLIFLPESLFCELEGVEAKNPFVNFSVCVAWALFPP